jgi:hypothetical protein
MPAKRRKISDFTEDETNHVVKFCNSSLKLDPDDEETASLRRNFQAAQQKLTHVTVRWMALICEAQSDHLSLQHVPFSNATPIDLVALQLPPNALWLRSTTEQLARQRGAAEIDGNIMTLDVTKQLLSIARSHVSSAV